PIALAAQQQFYVILTVSLRRALDRRLAIARSGHVQGTPSARGSHAPLRIQASALAHRVARSCRPRRNRASGRDGTRCDPDARRLLRRSELPLVTRLDAELRIGAEGGSDDRAHARRLVADRAEEAEAAAQRE